VQSSEGPKPGAERTEACRTDSGCEAWEPYGTVVSFTAGFRVLSRQPRDFEIL